jgi:hypothetical protein
MRMPRPRFTMRRLLALPLVIALGIVTVSSLYPLRRRVTHQAVRLGFRVVSALDKKPLGQARIVIDNLNLALELGKDSEAVTAPDGRASFTHRLPKRVPDPELAEFEGVYMYNDGYIYRKLGIEKTGMYHFQYSTHTGYQLESAGECSLLDGVLRLSPEGSTSLALSELMGFKLVPIPWGDRLYLVSE